MYHLISYLLCYLLYIEFIVFIVFIVICVVTNHAHVCQMHDQSIQIWGEKVWTIKITAIVIQISHTFLCYTIYVLDANIRLMYRVEFTFSKTLRRKFQLFPSPSTWQCSPSVSSSLPSICFHDGLAYTS